jgi:mannose/fructose-specific phosphotransferase system component IIA
MSELLRGVVVAHARLAEALVAATEQVSGVRGALTAVTNAECDRETLEQRVVDALDGRPGLVFVDLPTGSCFVAAMRLVVQRPETRVVTGVNLTMLLEFVFHRDLPLEEAARRAGETGVRAIAGR